MSAATERKASLIRHVVDEVNPVKSRLMDLVRQLEAGGAGVEARGLDKLVGQLEGWQARAADKANR